MSVFLFELDLDLQMTLTFQVSFNGIQANRRNSQVNNVNFLFDLELGLMTLILKSDLDMVKMYQYTENEVPSINGSKVIA